VSAAKNTSDLTGELVRWESRGQWLTARVDFPGPRGIWVGTVVDPGNYIGLSEAAPKQAVKAGDRLPNLRSELLTVITEAPVGEQRG
jgi:hypothetical protein